MKQSIDKLAGDILGLADIEINGTRPWDIRVNNPKFYNRVLSEGSLGLGESYMDGWWDVEALDQFFCRVLAADLQKKVSFGWKTIWHVTKALILNQQSKSRAFEVGEKHYDIGNDLYSRMLDKRMVYTCGYWKNASTLDEAQEAKLELVCKKMHLRPGMKVLDIGCGWGSFAKYAAEKHGVSVVGITISKEQAVLAKDLCAGLPVEIRLQDYRDVDQEFDRIISLGMFEHVGPKNYRTYMTVVRRSLVSDGLFLLHTIGRSISAVATDPWIAKYIFANGTIPSMKQIGSSLEGLFVMEDLHNFGLDYDKTLMAWHKNFVDYWSEIKSNYSERFYRMWTYYLLASAAHFRARENHLWQIVLSPKERKAPYEPVR